MDTDCNECGEIREVIEEPADSGNCGNSGLTWAYYAKSNKIVISGNGAMPDYKSTTMPWYDYKDTVTKVVFESGVKSIGAMAFYNFTAITEIELNDDLMVIGQYAFHGCSALSEVTIPESVVAIGRFAFRRAGITEATLINTDGWTAGSTALSSVDLDDTATAAEYIFQRR